MVNSEATNPTASTDKSRSGTAIAPENSEPLVAHPEEEVDNKAELMTVTGEASGG